MLERYTRVFNCFFFGTHETLERVYIYQYSDGNSVFYI